MPVYSLFVSEIIPLKELEKYGLVILSYKPRIYHVRGTLLSVKASLEHPKVIGFMELITIYDPF